MKKHWIQQAQLELGELCDGIDLSDAWAKYKGHGNRCKYNNKLDANGEPVQMRMTFVEWLRVWAESGHWHQRGAHSDGYVMARHHDLGHYEVGNVSITPHTQNVSDGSLGKERGERPNDVKQKISIGQKHRIAIAINGIEYPSIWAAVRATGFGWRYIKAHYG